MTAVVLAYHSHRVLGSDYARNDHVALARDLEILTGAGFEVVSLAGILAFASGEDTVSSGDFAAITFDDGPIYDYADFVHPDLGPQRGFCNILRDFRAAHPAAQPSLCATSFVIASPAARAVMEHSFDRTYTYLGPASMGEAWWRDAIASGLLSIANHSWDHLHPALERVAHSEQARADFTRVTTIADADAQIAAAQRYIASRTGGCNAPWFAYPFGHCNAFLAEEYFPSHGTGIAAAFTTEPRAVIRGDDRFRLPRFVCGEHWTQPAELESILHAAQSPPP